MVGAPTILPKPAKGGPAKAAKVVPAPPPPQASTPAPSVPPPRVDDEDADMTALHPDPASSAPDGPYSPSAVQPKGMEGFDPLAPYAGDDWGADDVVWEERKAQWELRAGHAHMYTFFHMANMPLGGAVIHQVTEHLPAESHQAVLDEMEVQWGGIMGSREQCTGLRARWAAAMGFPLTEAQLRTHITGPDCDEEHAAQRLQDADIAAGGTGDLKTLNPLSNVLCNLPFNAAFIETDTESFNKNDHTAWCSRLALAKDAAFPILLWEFDLYLDGNGLGHKVV